ncbi:phosphate ABC transporter permease PstA [Laspinema olomoucense]|uniref:Phosphate transport system permease protein PstA n=1 Tax=Laspinema olomoucense D3b TaxID=2953688 RepID=A0ABT2N6J7_9CYAN|nr:MULTISPECIES: phosphate ABC transporter permease PstA [unclassified Laspinema]MCT7972162.1 phosphate ABC transporter permease PstA [Laspinema sp. D3d]MCT7978297.1 phosphate ABC transporter permease PstA [Laspinema sp. D3b]MCT7991992.1 phosphate ABC transporter permease PstA [Laspinema sp. D3a]MCT7993125.1 phosphate ABC transporter permease PstA [Laspinema sp. D3c]
MRNYKSPRSLFVWVMTLLSGACLVITLIPLFAVMVYVTIKGFNRLNLDLFTQLPPSAGMEGGGIANAIAGTLIMVGIAAAISVPIGVFGAVYLSEFSSVGVARWIRFATNVLSGVPSIIVGIFAYGIIVLATKQFSAFAGGVALSVLMLPIVVRTTDEALQIVPPDVRWASVGVGASNYQTVLRVVLPAALPAIITGLTLAIARAAGETAPLIFTALFTFFWPQGLFEPAPSLAVLVYNFASVPYASQQELAWAASLILVLLVLLTSILARWATRKSIY